MTHKEQYSEFLAEHVPYELAMMHQTFSRLDNPGPDWNAFIESFCIHARNLQQFVTNNKGKGSNSIIARDFVQSFNAGLPKELAGPFQRLNIQIAHLAKTRTNDPANKFTADDARKIRAWLATTLCKFVAALDPNAREQWASAIRDAPTNVKLGQGQSATNAILTTQSVTSLFAEMKIVDASK